MYSRILTASLIGLKCEKVWAEANVENGLMSFSIVGLANQSIKESKERVRSAISNCNYEFPDTRITVNLTPAGMKKEGSHFDLAIALGIMLCTDSLRVGIDLENIAFLGELTLDGKIDPIDGALPMVIGLRENGIRKIVIPKANFCEASLVKDVEFYPFEHLSEVISFIADGETKNINKVNNNSYLYHDSDFDFADIKGQSMVKRAAQIAAAGFHGMLMIGPPGVGKSMVGKRIASILPPLSYEEQLEVTQIYSIAGLLSSDHPVIMGRPFRAPHHSMSGTALVGGGAIVKPGEVSFAHKGILFLDELPEFKSSVIDMLRQPLESGEITISRASGTYTYPSKFMLVAASNPCKCGYFGDQTHVCTCSDTDRKRYLARISGPLLDRIDLHILMKRPSYQELNSKTEIIDSKTLKVDVLVAVKKQQERYKNLSISYNSELTPSLIKEFCPLNIESQKIMQMAFDKWNLSARSYHRIIKVSRTIADLDNSDSIEEKHILEALSYRIPEGIIK